jgi:hypothetical protein
MDGLTCLFLFATTYSSFRVARAFGATILNPSRLLTIPTITFCFRLLLDSPDICVLLLLRTEMASDTGLVRRSLSIVRKRAQTLQEKVTNDEELPCR